MFEAALSDISGLPSANFFSVLALDLNLWRGYKFQMATYL